MSRTALFALGALLLIGAHSLATGRDLRKLDPALQSSARTSDRLVRVIVRTTNPGAVSGAVMALGGRTGRRLAGVRGVVAEVPEANLESLAAFPAVQTISLDRRIQGTLERTAAAIGARWVNENLGFDGTGIGVAVIDSGVTRSHDDLGANRIAHFVDFVDFQSEPHDGYGHGTHVAGIIAGNGHDSAGARRGVAPGAHLVVLKALDEQGDGYISNAIAALDYAIEHRAEYNIRVINLSVAAGVYESYKTDPLTLAAGRAVDAGIVVVTAAGNLGRNPHGRTQYGGITAPGNAP
jgi:serine protease AprX